MAFLIFITTLLLIIWKPFRLKVWIYTSLGTLFVFAFKLITWEDVQEIFGLTWDSSLTLIGLIIISLCLENLGFFDYLVGKILKRGKLAATGDVLELNTRKFCVQIIILTALTSALFANDGAVLIFTPLMVALLARMAKEEAKFATVLLLTTAFVCDAASLPLVVSNLTNIITAGYFDLNFASFAATMVLPTIASVITMLICFFIGCSRLLPAVITFKLGGDTELSPALKRFCFGFIACFVVGLFAAELTSAPVCVPVLCFAAVITTVMLIKNRGRNARILLKAPYDIVIFSFTLYLIVFAMYKGGLGQQLVNIYGNMTQLSLVEMLSTAYLSAAGAAIFNNLPMIMLGNLALQDFFVSGDTIAASHEALIYSHLAACNIGAKLTPIGSLSTLLWLGFLEKRGFTISVKQYFRFSFTMAIPVLLVVVTVIWLQEFVLQLLAA